MSDKFKVFGAGAIISPLLITMIIGMVSFVGLWASKVPALEATFKTEIKHLNKTLVTLTETASETNRQLKSYTANQAETISTITQTLIVNKYMIKQLQGSVIELKRDRGK